MDACTIVAQNYLPYARVLARSFQRHHPEGHFTALVIDLTPEEVQDLEESFEVLSPYAILSERDFHEMAMCYDVVELATAAKPFLLRHLLDGGRRSVTYFDPDIEIFAPLYDVGDLAEERSIVLTPHTLSPIPRDGLTPDEPYLLRAGVYNLGFIAVGEGSRPFLDWWCDRLRRDCVIAPERGLFVDQRWVDLAAGYFEHDLLRDPGCNVAYWNLGVRTVTGTRDDKYLVDGAPLRFFHFSGYDPRMPEVLSKHQGRAPRVRLKEEPALEELCDQYGAALMDAGFLEGSSHPYPYASLADGTPIDHQMRRGYRLALKSSDAGERPAPPDPFVEPQRYLRWWSSERTAVLGSNDLDLTYPPEFHEVLGAVARRPKLWDRVVRTTVKTYRLARKVRSLMHARGDTRR